MCEYLKFLCVIKNQINYKFNLKSKSTHILFENQKPTSIYIITKIKSLVYLIQVYGSIWLIGSLQFIRKH